MSDFVAPSGAPLQLRVPGILSELPSEGCFTPSSAGEATEPRTPHAPLVSAFESPHTSQHPMDMQDIFADEPTNSPHQHHHHQRSSSQTEDEFDWAFNTAAADLAPVLQQSWENQVAATSSAPAISSSSLTMSHVHLKRWLSSVPESEEEGLSPRTTQDNPAAAAAAAASAPGAALDSAPSHPPQQQQQPSTNLLDVSSQQPEGCLRECPPENGHPGAAGTAAAPAPAAPAGDVSDSTAMPGLNSSETGAAAGVEDVELVDEQQPNTTQQQHASGRQPEECIAQDAAVAAVVVIRTGSDTAAQAPAAGGKQHQQQLLVAEGAAAGGAQEEDEWEAANKQRLQELAGAKGPAAPGAAPPAAAGPSPAAYAAALSYLRSPGPLAEALGHQRAAVLQSLHKQRLSLGALLGTCCGGGGGAAAAQLQEERVWVLCLARLPLDTTAHPGLVSLLGGIHTAWTGRGGVVPRYGAHWAELGFQGDDPATDLRSAGLLGLLQLLHLPQHQPQLARDLFQLSHSESHEYPLAVVSLNISAWGLAALRGGALTTPATRQHSVLTALHNFHTAAFEEFHQRWSAGGSMRQAGFLLKQLEQHCRDQAPYLAAARPGPQ